MKVLILYPSHSKKNEVKKFKLIIHSEKTLCFFAFGLLALIQAYFLICAYNVPISAFDDAVVQTYPAGMHLAQAQSAKEFGRGLIASFFGEEHLFFTGHLMGAVHNIFFSALAPVEWVHIRAKIFYILAIVFYLLVAQKLWNNRYKTLFCFAALVFNQALSWRVEVSSFQELAVPMPFLTFFLLLSYLNSLRWRYLVAYFVSFIIMTLNYEAQLVMSALFGFFTVAYFFQKTDILLGNKIRQIVIVGFVSVLALVPYFAIHFYVYGTPFQPSKSPAIESFSQLIGYLANTFAAQFDLLFYGFHERYLSKFNFSVIVQAILYLSVLLILLLIPKKYKLITWQSKVMLFCFLIQMLMIAYSGRPDHGIWFVVGVQLCLIFADLLYNVWISIKNKFFIGWQSGYFLPLVLIVLSVLLLREEKRQHIERYGYQLYYKFHDYHHAYFNAIGESNSKHAVIRLPSAETHYSALHGMLWAGNQVYQKERSFWFYNDLLRYDNGLPVFIEHYRNFNKQPFSHFDSMLLAFAGNNKVVLLETKNMFQRIFLNTNQNKIARAAVFDSLYQTPRNLYFSSSQLQAYRSGPFEIRLKFLKSVPLEAKIKVNDKIVSYKKTSKDVITVSLTKLTMNLKVEIIRKQSRKRKNKLQLFRSAVLNPQPDNLVQISVDYTGARSMQTKNTPSIKSLHFVTNASVCNFEIDNQSDVAVFASVQNQQDLLVKPLFLFDEKKSILSKAQTAKLLKGGYDPCLERI